MLYGAWIYVFFSLKKSLKGGLIGLAAATVGLTSEAAQHLEVRGY